MKTFYITTAIDYVNGSPHLGHAYEQVLTDVIARFRRLMGDRVYFLTGVDEHGQKVQQSAQRARRLSRPALDPRLTSPTLDQGARVTAMSATPREAWSSGRASWASFSVA